jgi:hypothetical protein
MEDRWPLTKVISGGQTGADRAGLEVAKQLGYETGGTVPRGYKTSKGPDPTLKEFGVVEHSSDRYPPRTIKNVRDGDGTVWFGNKETSGGKLTIGTARRMAKPLIINPTAEELRLWIMDHNISVLNVAGDRETNSPGTQTTVEKILAQALAREDSVSVHHSVISSSD